MTIQQAIQSSIATAALVFVVSGCSEPLSGREKGALIGGAGGAGAGALIGEAAAGEPAAGAAIGGAAGALGGAVVGDERDRRD